MARSRRIAGGWLAPDRGEAPIRAIEADDGDDRRRLVEERHVDRGLLAPEAEQRAFALGEQADRVAPGLGADDDARPRPVAVGAAAVQAMSIVGFRHGDHPSSLATCWNQATSGGGR